MVTREVLEQDGLYQCMVTRGVRTGWVVSMNGYKRGVRTGWVVSMNGYKRGVRTGWVISMNGYKRC